ncbi:MAG: sigma-70 family RNA polymerase sigma factor [Candidatus Nealsonbacteria bacterium]|nr:sigma-70 family RNA polymerase sigma factor [Candidatus Nealsonbacteria bacterium]
MTDEFSQTAQIRCCLDRFSAGEESAREELVSHAGQWLQGRVRLMLRSYPHVRRWEETDDLVNQALLRLHRALAEVQPSSVQHFLNLANAQIRRELIDMARHYFGAKGMGAHHATDGLSPDTDARPRYEVAQDTFEPARVSEWTEFHEQVEALPEKEKEVFGLRWYDGLTFAEIGQVLEVTDRTAKRRWRSSCVMLYKAMQGDIPGS